MADIAMGENRGNAAGRIAGTTGHALWVGFRWIFSVRGIGLLLLAGFIALRIFDPAPVKSLRLKTFDIYQLIKPNETPNTQVAIVDIDEDSLNDIGQWPWPRTQIAQMVINLVQSGAAVVGFDVVFAEPDRMNPESFARTAAGLSDEMYEQIKNLPSNDAVLANILKQTPVVLGQAASPQKVERNKDRKPMRSSIASKNGKPHNFLVNYQSVTRNLEILEQAAPGRGMFSLVPETDGIVRRVPSVLRVDKTLYPALSIEMLRVANRARTLLVKSFPLPESEKQKPISQRQSQGIEAVSIAGYDIPTDINGLIWIRAAHHDPDLYLSAGDILKGTFDKEKVKGKLVLVGTSAEGLKDIRSTPVEDAMPGVEVHAQILNTILHEDYLVRPPTAIAIELLVVLISGLLMIWLIPRFGAAISLAVFAGQTAILFGAGWVAFSEYLLLIDVTYPTITSFILFGQIAYSNYANEEAQKKQVRGAFSQYLSPALVEQLADEPERLTLGGEMREMTFLFCDVRGFTSISESFKGNPQGLTELINRLLTPLTNEILSREGTIDKYMGDCIMAFWNAPLDVDDQEGRACDAALAMLDALDVLNAEREEEDKAIGKEFLELKIGLGINTGECVVGNMGSDQRFDYSVLGDAVNLASRLEGQSKSYGVHTVLGSDTAAKVRDRFAVISLDLIAVKGKVEAVDIYGLLGNAEMAATEDFKKLNEMNEQMIETYRRQDWDGAEALMTEIRKNPLAPQVLYDLYQERIDDYRQNPPSEDWDGVFVATTK